MEAQGPAHACNNFMMLVYQVCAEHIASQRAARTWEGEK